MRQPQPASTQSTTYEPLKVVSSTNSEYYFLYEINITTDSWGNTAVFYDGTPQFVQPYQSGFYRKWTSSGYTQTQPVSNVSAIIKYNGSTTPPSGSPTTATTVNVVITMTTPVANTFSYSFVIQPKTTSLSSITVNDATVSTTFDGTNQDQSNNFTGNLNQPILISYKGTGATTYGPSSTPPTNAGTYLVTASITGTVDYTSASTTSNLTINKITHVDFFEQNTIQSQYTGSPVPVTFTTIPSGLSYTVKYNGSLTPPTNIGAYTIVGQITDSNVVSNATGVVSSGLFTIVKSNQITSSTANSTTLVRATYSYAMNKFLVDFVGTYQ